MSENANLSHKEVTKLYVERLYFLGYLLTIIISKCIVFVRLRKGGLLKMMLSGRLRKKTLNNK
ncbi:hypothetical protein BTS2_1527 [Bacillus sp. TS-2]|nr:hypothetical protein BTS2_1527 [Bacillus sp. TS-2]